MRGATKRRSTPSIAALGAMLCAAGCTVSGAPVPDGGVAGGVVRLYQHASGGGELSAAFARAGCSLQAVGPCDLELCAPGMGDDAGAGARSAGTLRVKGLLRDLTLPPLSDGTYPTVSEGHLWAGGERADVHADGAGVASFDASVTTPHLSMFVGPTPVTPPRTWDRTHDLPFSWLGADDVHVALVASSATGAVRADCSFAGGNGTGSVSSIALSLFPPGVVTYAAGTRARRQLLAGGDTVVSVEAEQAGTAPSGGDFSGMLNLQ